jgi:SAM-dependent methyltransferase
MMNQKIYNLLVKNLKDAFKLPKYEKIRESINQNTVLGDLPWTPKKYEKFIQEISQHFHSIDLEFKGTISELTNDIDAKYRTRVWGGEMWKPRTEIYRFTGWNIVKEINDLNPRAVLDVGCGFNQFKPHIKNLIGIDPYNPNADYMVDILDFVAKPESFDAMIIFGSLNFYDYDWVASRFKKCFELLAPGGRAFCRGNPFNTPPREWIEVFNWDFASAVKIAEENNVTLETWKQDNGDRFYFVFHKPKK